MELRILHAGVSHPSPYFYNFCRALKKISPEIDISLDPSIPFSSPKDHGILHFHRLKRFYSSDSQRSAENFLDDVKKAKRNGWGVAWTIHNFFPIDRRISDVDLRVTSELSKLSDILFTHTELMKTNAEKLFSKKVINNSYSANELDGLFDRDNLEVSIGDYEVVFAIVGNITPYKCVPECIESFKELKKRFSDKKMGLIIAGPLSKEVSIEDYVNRDKDISVHNIFIGNSAWRELNKTADVFLGTYNLSLPAFRYGFFPSNVPQILNYKKALILPDCLEMREFAPSKEIAIFYDSRDKEGLLKAMEEGMNSSRISSIEKNLKEFACGASWTEVAKIVIKGYRSLVGK